MTLAHKRLESSLNDNTNFTVIAELTGGPGYSFNPIVQFLGAHKDSGGSGIPAGFDFTGITLPQNPGGVANIIPAEVLSKLISDDLLGELDVIPHISCKDGNTDSLTSILVGYRERDVRSLLVLTGDKPAKSLRVFELESIGLLGLVKSLNQQKYIKSSA